MSYYKRNRKKVLAQQKEYYEKNKKKVIERNRKYRLSLSPEERKRRRRKIYEKQKEKIQIENILKRYGENGLFALKRENYICQKCKTKGEYGKSKGKVLIHHIDLNDKNNNLNNLMILCVSCHKKLHSKLYEKVLETISSKQIKQWTKEFF